jgi:quercetin dioxygenase-like cupin family protein
LDDAGAGVTKRARAGTLALAGATVVAFLAVPAHAARTEPLAQGTVKALPPGGAFLSIVDLPQPPGASFGPHGHVPGFVYALSDNVTTVANGSEMALNRGEGHFIPALAAHTHKNADNRLPAATLAIGLVVGVIALLLVAKFAPTRGLLVPALLATIIAGGAIALWDPWENDWFFISVRPESARGAPMPLPSASRTYESPEFSSVPAGPYAESLATTTVEPRDQMTLSNAPGPVVLLVLDGRADVTVGNGPPTRLGHHDAALVQARESARVVNPSGSTLRLLGFSLIPTRSQ